MAGGDVQRDETEQPGGSSVETGAVGALGGADRVGFVSAGLALWR